MAAAPRLGLARQVGAPCSTLSARPSGLESLGRGGEAIGGVLHPVTFPFRYLSGGAQLSNLIRSGGGRAGNAIRNWQGVKSLKDLASRGGDLGQLAGRLLTGGGGGTPAQQVWRTIGMLLSGAVVTGNPFDASLAPFKLPVSLASQAGRSVYGAVTGGARPPEALRSFLGDKNDNTGPRPR